jgi:hypothetical protein
MATPDPQFVVVGAKGVARHVVMDGTDILTCGGCYGAAVTVLDPAEDSTAAKLWEYFGPESSS